MQVSLFIEGQEDVKWSEWLDLAQTAEACGFHGLYRSDHYLSVDGDLERGSLDAWGTLCGLAASTKTLRLGTLVSPVMFRHPSTLARLVVVADHISGGRIDVGVGAGWMQLEHQAHGFEFPKEKDRFDALEEQLAILHASWAPGAFSFDGRFFKADGVDVLPKPVQQPHPPIIIGAGSGPKPRSISLAAEWADEYNIAYVDVDQAAAARGMLDEECERQGRDPSTLRLSVMCGFLVADNQRDIEWRQERVLRWHGKDPHETWLIGKPAALGEQVSRYAEVGVEKFMLLHILHRDLEALELLGSELPL